MLCPLELLYTSDSFTSGRLVARPPRLPRDALEDIPEATWSSNWRSSMYPLPSFREFVKAARHCATSSESLT